MEPRYAEFLIAALVVELTPGPNMAWLALLSAQQGRKAGLIAVAGILTGLGILAIAAASGATAFLSAYPAAYELVRWAGVLFLLYLALEAWVGKKAPANGEEDHGRHFVRAIILNVLNPKAATVFVVLIPGFAGSGDGASQHLLIMTVAYLGIATLAHLVIVAFANLLSGYIANPAREAIARRITALLLVAIAVWVVVSTAPAP